MRSDCSPGVQVVGLARVAVATGRRSTEPDKPDVSKVGSTVLSAWRSARVT